MAEFLLIGAGMGCESLLTAQARQAIMEADTVLATPRLAQGLRHLRDDIASVGFADLAQRALACEGTVAVLLSGDTGFFSAARGLSDALRGHGTVRLLPGVSSLQVFAAKVGISYDDAVWLSVHGREGEFIGPVSYHQNVFLLTGGQMGADTVCRRLRDAGLRHVRVWIGERLGMPEEHIVSGTPEELADMIFDSLCIVLIVNNSPANPYGPLRDDVFVRGDVPMTKQEVRWLACDMLSVCPTDIVYDVGAGTGSVSMELARRARCGHVFAMECNDAACQLIESNRLRTGSYHVTVVPAMAPEGLYGLPTPDCAFIGGSKGNMGQIVAALREKNPAIRIVITAIALETVDAATRALQDNGFCTTISCLNVARSRAVGEYHMMMAHNPVYVIGGNV